MELLSDFLLSGNGWFLEFRGWGSPDPFFDFLFFLANLPPPFLESSRGEGSPYLLAVFWFACPLRRCAPVWLRLGSPYRLPRKIRVHPRAHLLRLKIGDALLGKSQQFESAIRN